MIAAQFRTKQYLVGTYRLSVVQDWCTFLRSDIGSVNDSRFPRERIDLRVRNLWASARIENEARTDNLDRRIHQRLGELEKTVFRTSVVIVAIVQSARALIRIQKAEVRRD